MRVVVLSWHPSGGMVTAGGFRRAVEVVRRLSDRASVVVIDAQPSMYGGDDAVGVEVVEYRLPALRWVSRVHRAAPRALQWVISFVAMTVLGTRAARRSSPVVVYVPSSELLPCSLAAAVVKRLSGAALVFSNHNLPDWGLRWIMTRLHNSAHAITTSSGELERGLRGRGVMAPIAVTQNGPTGLPPGASGRGEAPLEWDGIFVGRHTPEKGILDLLDVWEQVVADDPLRRLVAIGSAPPWMTPVIEERLERSTGLPGAVVIAGVVPDHAKFDMLRRSRVLLATSRVEGWGFVPLEALSCGVPVVCWDLDVYRESLPECPGVVRVPTGDVSAFAAAVAQLLALSDRDRSALVRYQIGSSPTWNDVAAAEHAVMVTALRAKAGQS